MVEARLAFSLNSFILSLSNVKRNALVPLGSFDVREKPAEVKPPISLPYSVWQINKIFFLL